MTAWLQSRFLSRLKPQFPFAVYALCLVCMVNFLGAMSVNFIALHLKGDENWTLGAIARIMMVYAFGVMGGGYLSGKWCDRFDSRKVLLCSLILQGLWLGLLSFSSSVLCVAGAIFWVGFFESAFRPAFNVTLARIVPSCERARAYSVYLVSTNLAIAAASLIGGLLMPLGFHYLCWFDASTCLAAGLLLLTIKGMIPACAPRSAAATADGQGVAPWRNSPYLFFCLLTLSVSFVYFQARVVSPVYLQEVHHIDSRMYGFLLMLQGLTFVVFQLPIISRAQRLNPFLAAGVGALLQCVGYGVFPLCQSLIFMAFAFTVNTLGQMLFIPTNVSLVTQVFSGPRQGKYLGVYQTTHAFAQLLAPSLGSWLYMTLTPNGFWSFVAFLGCVVFAGYQGLDSRLKSSGTPLWLFDSSRKLSRCRQEG